MKGFVQYSGELLHKIWIKALGFAIMKNESSDSSYVILLRDNFYSDRSKSRTLIVAIGVLDKGSKKE